ncbi:hypothetical protein QBC43DRAFT_372274 [Cladorrhinum sp. PSN259]|nr:hypothetical protein QBC43DRAFT_372274 [Cladorrhinum sp. PSN259]
MDSIEFCFYYKRLSGLADDPSSKLDVVRPRTKRRQYRPAKQRRRPTEQRHPAGPGPGPRHPWEILSLEQTQAPMIPNGSLAAAAAAAGSKTEPDLPSMISSNLAPLSLLPITEANSCPRQLGLDEPEQSRRELGNDKEDVEADTEMEEGIADGERDHDHCENGERSGTELDTASTVQESSEVGGPDMMDVNDNNTELGGCF